MEVKFEELEKSPMPVVEQIFDRFKLPEREESLQRIRAYLDSLSGYRKNRFTLSEADRARVEERWGKYVRRWNYQPPAAA